MRQIEKEMVQAIAVTVAHPRTAGGWHKGNTSVRCHHNGTVVVSLHMNEIFRRAADGNRYFTLAGWDTPTTRSRLRSCGVSLERVRGVTKAYGVELLDNRWYAISREGNAVIGDAPITYPVP